MFGYCFRMSQHESHNSERQNIPIVWELRTKIYRILVFPASAKGTVRKFEQTRKPTLGRRGHPHVCSRQPEKLSSSSFKNTFERWKERNAVNNFQSLGAVKGSIVRKSWQASDMKFMNLIDVFTHWFISDVLMIDQYAESTICVVRPFDRSIRES